VKLPNNIFLIGNYICIIHVTSHAIRFFVEDFHCNLSLSIDEVVSRTFSQVDCIFVPLFQHWL